MGATLVRAVEGKDDPTVGLLNIGSEEIKGNEVVKKAGELLRAVPGELPRQRRGRRHLQGHHRRGGVRRLRRQRGAQDLRGPGQDAGRLPQGGVHALAAHAARGAHLDARHQALPPARGPSPLQRRGAPRAARHRGQEPRLGRPPRVRHGARARQFRGEPRPGGAHRRGDLAAERRAAARRPRDVSPASPAPAATSPRRSSPTRTWRRSSRPATSGSSRAPASASATSPPTGNSPATWRCTRAARRWKPPGARADDVDLIIIGTSTPDMVFPSSACILQKKLGVKRGAAFDVQAVCTGFVYALAIADLFIKAGTLQVRARGRRRGLLAHPRLEGPRHLRAVRRRRRRGGAGGLRHARDPVEPPARRRQLRGHPRTPGHVARARSRATPRSRWTAARCSSSRCSVLEESAREALAANGMQVADIDWLDPAPGQHAHHRATSARSSACPIRSAS